MDSILRKLEGLEISPFLPFWYYQEINLNSGSLQYLRMDKEEKRFFWTQYGDFPFFKQTN